MKNKIISAILVMMMLVPCVNYVMASEEETVIHVAVTGNDDALGTKEKPLATLKGAKDRVKRIKIENPDASVRVIFHEGVYRFEKGVEFGAADMGTEEKPVIYQGAEGEKVDFVGSKSINIENLKPVSDKTIKDRLKSEVADFVGEINLREFGITNIEEFSSNDFNEPTYEIPGLFLDGVEQPIAQYPNGFGQYSYWDSIVSPGGNTQGKEGGTIAVTDENVRNWKNIDDAYVGIYASNDYRYVRINVASVDTQKKTITLKKGTEGTIKNPESKRWKIFNLLEELDSPGEWFADRNTLMLYYYAPYNVRGKSLEFATLTDPFITFKNSGNLIFSNINFSKSKGYGITFQAKNENITITNCSFENIEKAALKLRGSNSGSFEAARNYLVGSSRIKITNNSFYNLGGAAMYTNGGGNRETLTSCENVFSNNYVEKVTQRTLCHAAVFIEGGIGWTIEHNVIHNIPFHAINFFGNDHVIRYNDISNACMESTDAAVIYNGRSFVSRGSDVSYNYIHNYRIKGEGLHLDQVPGIYLDDNQCEVYMHNNIFKTGGIGIYINKGKDNEIKDNIMTDVDRPFKNTSGGQPGDAVVNAAKIAAALPGWTEKYPNLQACIDEPSPSIRNTITGNVASGEIKFEKNVADRNIVENNMIYTDTDAFVNPENGDYRLKSDSEIAKKFPNALNDKNFDISDFGLIKSEGIEYPRGDFKKLYPKNGDCGIDSSNIKFLWEGAKGATEYRLVIAKDPYMKDVVFDEISYYQAMDVNSLQSNATPYYYTVYARDIYGDEWQALGVPYRFTTSQYSLVKNGELDEVIRYVSGVVDAAKEGEDVGYFKPGTVSAMKEILEKAKGMLTWRDERDGEQSEIDNTVEILKNITGEENINSGYYGIEDMVQNENEWVTDRFEAENALVVQDNTVTLFAEDGSLNAQYHEMQSIMASRNTVRKFKAKFDFLNNGWFGLGLRCPTNLTPPAIWLGTNSNYFIAVKQDIIELQRAPGGIIKEIPNTFIKNGEWHEIEFGVLNSTPYPVVIVNVDGKNVVTYEDTLSSPKFEEGGFCVYVSNKNKLTLMPSDEKDKEFPYNNLLVKKLGDNNYIAYKNDCTTAYGDKSEITLDKDKAIMVSDKLYVPLRTTVENMGYSVRWKEENYAEIATGEKIIKLYPDKTIYYTNNYELTISDSIMLEGGVMRLTIEDLAQVLGVKYKKYDDGIGVIGKNLDDISEDEIKSRF